MNQSEEKEEAKRTIEEDAKFKETLSKIKYKVMVISGKGGVGKSFVTANLAMAFALKGYAIGVLDADVHGPSIPRMLGLKGEVPTVSPLGVFPVIGPLNIKVMSMDFLIPSDEIPVAWRSPLKVSILRQFISDVIWGDLDILFIDLPPGTGDEVISIAQLLQPDFALVITIPSEVSKAVVKKVITFTRTVNVPILGIVENMSYFVCPNCKSKYDLFGSGGGKKLAEEMRVPFLGAIPIDPSISEACDKGLPYIAKYLDNETSKLFFDIVSKFEEELNKRSQK
ncbi:MAG: Mrp/NBP35 family ATP-binding protein [Candidatus Nezhaarchaeota archaeon]|nr:Mrp/NBP35 family ATP-binding protein [Candidatus Nezhaarchaeota archaeon]MCX8141323.1 Mrp/NBP35 family ATP-binding protein [Candidatus Nezhaarchaeota archaeon]MDW8049589.1 Mrp/NBP35 family ATP-binding protein [Nitrososphaerota archaeon]